MKNVHLFHLKENVYEESDCDVAVGSDADFVLHLPNGR